jgi:4-cresol dehydrogenase (hydroxylating) flavoprotein subunit
MATSRSATLDPDTVSAAISRFTEVLGAAAVVTGRAAVAEYDDPFSFSGWGRHQGTAVVMPETTEQVQAIVRIAGELGTPLWPFSQGRNNAYGGPSAVLGGSIQVSLRRMNKILDVNEKLGTALVEPGVRFFDMYDHLRANDIKLWSSAPDLGWGSIVGNALECGVGYTVHGDHAGRSCGMEVVLPTGRVIRTGMGALPGSDAWQAHPRGFGPTLDGIFRQSNFGIVTKMGIWLMPEPEAYFSGVAAIADPAALPAFIDAVRPLVLDGTFQNHVAIGNAIFVASTLDGAPTRAEVFDGPGPIPHDVVKSLAARLGIGAWNMRFALYGTPAIVQGRLARIRSRLEALDGVTVDGTQYRGSDVHELASDQNAQVQAGIPSLELMRVLDWYSGPGGGHIDFSVVAPLRGDHVSRVHAMMDRVLAGSRLDYDPAMILSGRHMINVSQIYFHPDDETAAGRAFDIYPRLIEAAAVLGYGLYRTHVAFMDEAAAKYTFNDGIQRRFAEKIKDALDPAGILAPGKQGIWPAALRQHA